MFDAVQELFGKYGFEGVYRKRPHGMPDGVAIFYKASRFHFPHKIFYDLKT